MKKVRTDFIIAIVALLVIGLLTLAVAIVSATHDQTVRVVTVPIGAPTR